ncbi:GyrI-like domain-containing protein [Arthrobacter echini]|uniref:GyrI-like domain-containing protein n=1 Tax=Arthrobacter echini TaxID=1529066 RepID=A0A4S5EA80_9MICC|nr:GyrI-like domain-containing protein [Arthrobacter echini]THJ68500.1 GyrI-like domain-containing protein [Arthrobacter echini]
MSQEATNHGLGVIDRVTRADTPALSRDVPFELSAIQAAWPEFENAFDSLQGRRMMGLVFNDDDRYRMSSVRVARDEGNPLRLDETVIPGGDYLRLRLRGEPSVVYGQLAQAFEVLFENADQDPGRPHIEYYRRAGEVDCLVPVHAQS